MAAFPSIRIKADARVRRVPIAEDLDCVIVDDFLEDPMQLVEFSARHAGSFTQPHSGYPGIQLRVDDTAATGVHRFLRARMTRQFPFLRGGSRLETFLSMVTLKPEALWSLQRICHIDPNPDPGRAKYAGLVYLFEDERLGGTSFYRWRDRDLIWRAADLLRDDPDRGLAFLRERFPTFREPPRYMTASNEIAELLGTIPARFNRLVFYPGDVPHSGAITAPELLSDDPRHGRLTLNLFASVLPR